MAVATVTNPEFAGAVGISESMASRLLNGHRLPSVAVMNSIARAYGIPIADLATAHAKGSTAFGKLLRDRVERPGHAAPKRRRQR